MKTHPLFKATKEEHELISKCVDRALKVNPALDRLSLNMDLTATHSNGCPMDFQKLLDAPPFDFSHDVAGIMRHIDRNTGELTRCFRPRCAARG